MNNLTQYQLKKIRDYIHRKTGIYIQDSKLDIFLSKKLERIMEKYRYIRFHDFFSEMIKGENPILFQELIDNVTVNETYFFREKEHFFILTDYILPSLDKNERIKILSAPCSTGEEVYSINISLIEKDLPTKKIRFHITGVDINSRAIKKAKSGVFEKNSMRTMSPDLLKKYFQREGKLYRINKRLTENVSFYNLNIFDRYKMKTLGKFDVVFSRNMLIYFSDKKRNEAVLTFYRMLKKGGYLILGHAERIDENIKKFRRLNINGCYIYIKD